MMKNLKVVLFDMDGVVVQSEQVWTKAVRITEKAFDLDFSILSDEQRHGWATIDVFNFLLAKEENKGKASIETIVDFINETFRTNLGEIGKLTDGVVEVFDFLKSRNIPMVLVSNSERNIIDYVLQFYSIQHYFVGTVSVDDVLKGKPDPSIYQKGLEIANVAADNAYAIEDSNTGIQAASSAGIEVVGFTNMNNPKAIHSVMHMPDFLEFLLISTNH